MTTYLVTKAPPRNHIGNALMSDTPYYVDLSVESLSNGLTGVINGQIIGIEKANDVGCHWMKFLTSIQGRRLSGMFIAGDPARGVKGVLSTEAPMGEEERSRANVVDLPRVEDWVKSTLLNFTSGALNGLVQMEELSVLKHLMRARQHATGQGIGMRMIVDVTEDFLSLRAEMAKRGYMFLTDGWERTPRQLMDEL